MKQKNSSYDEEMKFEFTKEYIRIEKIKEIILFIMFLSILALLGPINEYISTDLAMSVGILACVCMLKYGILKNFRRSGVYIKNGKIVIKKYYDTKAGLGDKVYEIRRINDVVLKKSIIIIYGYIICSNDRVLKKVKIPRRLRNVDELIQFIESRVTEEPYKDSSVSHYLNGEGVRIIHIRRIDLWNCVNKAFMSDFKKYVPLPLVSLFIGVFCFYLWYCQQVDSLLLLLSALIFSFLGAMTIIWFTIYAMNEFGVDILFKRLKKYEGYLYGEEQLSNFTINPHYKEYHETIFYGTRRFKKDAEDARHFLVKDNVILRDIDKDKKIEVLYLKKSKIIYSIDC